MKSRANHLPYRTLCTAVACLLTLAVEQSSIGQATEQHQSPDKHETCPIISVSCSSYLDYAKPLTFTAESDRTLPETVYYDWELSAGTILDGQGEAVIKVDMSAFRGQSITATVTVHGLPKNCRTQASCSMTPGAPPPPVVLFDTYYPKSIGAAAPKKTRRRRRLKATLISHV